VWLGYAAATSGLMDVCEDRSLPMKRWTLGAFVMGLVALDVCARQAGQPLRDVGAGASLFATASIAAMLLFVLAGEPVTPTRWMLAHAPSPLVGILYPRCLAPSIFFTLTASGTVLLLVPLIAGASIALVSAALWAVMFLCALGGFIGSMAARYGGTRARWVGATSLVGLMLLPALLRHDSPGFSWVDGIGPLVLVRDGGTHAQSVVVYSLLGWAATAVASITMMLFAVRASARKLPNGSPL
jgi:hypothetical protein